MGGWGPELGEGVSLRMPRGHCAGSWVPLTLQLAAPTTSPADSNRLGFRQPQKRKSTKKMKSGVTSVPPCSPFPQGAAKPCQQVPGPAASRAGEGRPRAPQREKPKPDAGRCLRRCVPRAGARCRPPPPAPRPGDHGTSEDSELGVDRDLPGRVLGHTLVHILVPGRPERLDPQHGPRAPVELDRLPRRGTEGG